MPLTTPSARKLPILFSAAALTLALAILGPGCSNEPAFDPVATYTPESLAQELAIRIRDLEGDARKTSSKAGRGKAAAPLKGDVLTKSGESKKEPAPDNADVILDDIVRKIRDTAPKAPRDFCKKVAAAFKNDNTLDPRERDDIVKRLDQLAGEL